MDSAPFNTHDEAQISTLYHQFLDSWNRRDAQALADLFEAEANVIGFDGSQMNGREDVRATISKIFADHQTAPYIGKVREVRFLSSDVAILRAVVGMIPLGQSDINPAVNAIQSLVAKKHDDGWQIALFQNTPAQFHGRPDLAQALSDELRELL